MQSYVSLLMLGSIVILSVKLNKPLNIRHEWLPLQCIIHKSNYFAHKIENICMHMNIVMVAMGCNGLMDKWLKNLKMQCDLIELWFCSDKICFFIIEFPSALSMTPCRCAFKTELFHFDLRNIINLRPPKEISCHIIRIQRYGYNMIS